MKLSDNEKNMYYYRKIGKIVTKDEQYEKLPLKQLKQPTIVTLIPISLLVFH